MSEIKVLHVDDEPDIRLLVEASLGLDPNLMTQSVATGEEALNVASHWNPHVILLDATMPGMDGAATLAHLQSNPKTASIPVVFLTANSREVDVDHFRSIGSVGVIAKPFDPRALASAVRDHLTSTQGTSEASAATPTVAYAGQSTVSPADTAANNEMGVSTSGAHASMFPASAANLLLLDVAGHPFTLGDASGTAALLDLRGPASSPIWSLLKAGAPSPIGLLDGSPSAAGPDGGERLSFAAAAGSSIFDTGLRASGYAASSDPHQSGTLDHPGNASPIMFTSSTSSMPGIANPTHDLSLWR